MGIALTIIGAIISTIGLLAFLATLNNAIANASASLVCLVGVVLLVGGIVVDSIKTGVRQLITVIRETKKSE